MGEWYDYEIRFANKDKNIFEEAKKRGLITIKPDNTFPSIQNMRTNVSLDLDKLGNPKAVDYYKTHKLTIGAMATYDDTNEYDETFRDFRLIYCNKWVPSNGLCFAISETFPDDVIEFAQYSPYGNDDEIIFAKNGQFTDRVGTPLIKDEKGVFFLSGIKNTMVKQISSDTYIISLPIGEDNDLWGKIKLDSNHCAFDGRRYSLYFTEPNIDVQFRSGTVNMNLTNLFDAYYSSFDKYRNKMQKEIYIPLYLVDFRDILNEDETLNYHLASIPCPYGVSENGRISVVVPPYTTPASEAGNFPIGPFGKTRNARVVKDGEYITKQLTNGQIYDAFVEETGYTEPVQAVETEQQEETEDIEL